jgi:RNA polymerase sigma-70 factor (ECF subfamily)
MSQQYGPIESWADSFTIFVKETEPKLKMALCASLGRETGMEATAHAFEYGWQHWGRISEMENPAGYLWRVGRNRGRRLRTRKRKLFQDVRTDRMPWIEPELPSAIAGLSERQRVSVILVYGLGWSFAEVAEMLGVSRSTVQKHAERAMRRLRHKLGVEP